MAYAGATSDAGAAAFGVVEGSSSCLASHADFPALAESDGGGEGRPEGTDRLAKREGPTGATAGDAGTAVAGPDSGGGGAGGGVGVS